MINLNGTEVGILKCTENDKGYNRWTVEGIYPVYFRGGQNGFYIIDNEGDKRSGTSIQDIIDLLTESGVTLEAVLEKPSPESVKTEGSMKVVCKATPRPNWWTVGKVYEVHTSKHRLYLLDDEGDERFLSGQSLEAAIKYQNDYYGTVFEPAYAETSNEDLIERIKKEIERLNTDQENLFGKRDRINGQAIQLGVKARKLEEVLEVLEEYK